MGKSSDESEKKISLTKYLCTYTTYLFVYLEYFLSNSHIIIMILSFFLSFFIHSWCLLFICKPVEPNLFYLSAAR